MSEPLGQMTCFSRERGPSGPARRAESGEA